MHRWAEHRVPRWRDDYDGDISDLSNPYLQDGCLIVWGKMSINWSVTFVLSDRFDLSNLDTFVSMMTTQKSKGPFILHTKMRWSVPSLKLIDHTTFEKISPGCRTLTSVTFIDCSDQNIYYSHLDINRVLCLTLEIMCTWCDVYMLHRSKITDRFL